MRTNQRNRETVWFALYQGISDVTDANGNLTGEHREAYASPRMARMKVSRKRGTSRPDAPGMTDPFTVSLITEDLTTPFDTSTIWWVGIPVKIATPHNFRCTGVATSINTRTIYLEEVNVS